MVFVLQGNAHNHGGTTSEPEAPVETMPPFVVSVDIGTTACKVAALDLTSGRYLAQASANHNTNAPDRESVQDPENWWDAFLLALARASEMLASRSIPWKECRGIGLTGQMHSLLLVDRLGKPVGPALTWADRRAASQAVRLSRDDRFRHLAGNNVTDVFSASKLLWAAENRPAWLANGNTLMLAKDYLRFRLTGEFVTDPTDAAGTLLYDRTAGQWADALWLACQANPSLAPAVLPSSAVAGYVTKEACDATGIPIGTPVVTGAGDVSATAVGCGVVSAGTIALNVGTAAQAMAVSASSSLSRCYLFVSAAGEPFLAMESVFSAGASIRWFEDAFAGSGSISDLAARSRPGANGLVYLPFMFDDGADSGYAGGAFVGQRPHHRIEDFARAVLEGVAFAVADAVHTVIAETGTAREVRVGGGVARSELFVSSLAAALPDSVEVQRTSGTSTRGAAILAAFAVAGWTLDDIDRGSEMSTVTPVNRNLIHVAHTRYKEACLKLRKMS